MFENLKNNLSKGQKTGIILIIEAIFVAVVIFLVHSALQPELNVEVANQNETPIPTEQWNGVKKQIWHLIEDNVDGVTKTNIDDAVIRDGTYEEETNNEITTAKFLLDIDSIKQTYAVTVSWSDTVELSDYVAVDCPSQDMMKYPDTVCYGMYNDTYSLDLYLPYLVRGEMNDSDVPNSPLYLITGSEEEKTITVMVSVCDAEKYKKEAMNYLRSTPIKLSEYTIEYQINEVDVNCQN